MLVLLVVTGIFFVMLYALQIKADPSHPIVTGYERSTSVNSSVIRQSRYKYLL
jgi:uncharacterized ion transporter superfamily protein YfcC